MTDTQNHGPNSRDHEIVPSGMPRLWVALLCCLCLSIPVVAVQFPPVTDLPQQVAQIRLFLESFDKEGSPSDYTIQWTKPGNACYLILGGAWALFGAENAGRVFLLVAVLLWVISAHILSAKSSRPLAGAILGSLMTYNFALYWGFLGFLLGFPAFCLLLYVLKSCSVRSLRGVVAWTVAAFLLYASHVLWLFFSIGYVAIHGLLWRENKSDLFLRIGLFIPFIVASMLWSMNLAGSTMDSGPVWVTIPFLERLSPAIMTRGALGPLPGVTLSVCFWVIVAYAVLVTLCHRGDFWKVVDKNCCWRPLCY